MGFPSSPDETGSSSYIHGSELKSYYERYRFIGSPHTRFFMLCQI
jgi:hypothetical protein